MITKDTQQTENPIIYCVGNCPGREYENNARIITATIKPTARSIKIKKSIFLPINFSTKS